MIPDLDPAIVAAATRLDGQALTAVYDAFADPIYRFIRFRVPSPDEAEDLTDQVFLKMIEAIPRYKATGAPFGAWLYRIARNVVIDSHRRRARDTVELHDTVPAHGADPFDAASRTLGREAVAEAMRALTDEQREVIVLRFVEGWDVAEVAAHMKRKPNAIHALQHRAVAALQRALGAAGAMEMP